MADQVTKEQLNIQKELLELQRKMGKVVSKSKIEHVFRISKSELVRNFVGIYDPEELREIIACFESIFLAKIKESVNKNGE